MPSVSVLSSVPSRRHQSDFLQVRSCSDQLSVPTWPARSLPYCRDDFNLEGGVAVVFSEMLFSVPALSSTHLQKLNGEDYLQH